MHTSQLIKSHLPCPDCGSTDALAEYSDGHTHCFSCGKSCQVKNYGTEANISLDKSENHGILSLSNTIGILKEEPKASLYPSSSSSLYHPSSLPLANTIAKEDIKEEIKDDKGREEKDIEPPKEYTYQYLSWRGINKETFRTYGSKFKIDTFGRPYSVVFPYSQTASKERRIDVKEFYWQGEANKASLFGMDIFSSGEAKAITITEGELDALAAFQMLGSKYPVVSVRSSTSARVDCERAYEYLNAFEKIYLCFDNDDPGQRAAREVSKLFDVSKVYHVKLSKYKDANEYLIHGEEKEFTNIWWSSRIHLPKGLIADYQSIEKALRKEDGVSQATYPFSTLQDMTYGIRSKEVVLLLAQEKVGKVLQIDTPLPTPTGWTTVGALKEGDYLFGKNGDPVLVTFVTDVHTRPYYRVEFSDGTSLNAGDNHRWTVRDLFNKMHVKTTQELYDTPGGIVVKGSKARWVVPNIEAVDLPEKDLLIDPHLLGVWLADGTAKGAYLSLSLEKKTRLHKYTREYAYKNVGRDCWTCRFSELTAPDLKVLGVLNNKHIPAGYLRASAKQRQALFEGLMFDGWRGDKGKQQNEFCSSNKQLFDQVVELARSLGYIVTESKPRVGRYKKDGEWVTCKTAYRFRWRTAKWKAIRSIEPIGNLSGRCLTVDHPDHLFAAGDGWTLTHNTEVMRAIEYHLLKTTDDNIGIIHLEEEEKRSVQGLIGYELSVPCHLPDAGVSIEDQLEAYRQLTRRDGRVHYYSHFGSQDPDDVLQIIRYLVTVCHCQYIFLDHITMLVTGYEGDDERKKLDYLSTRLAMMTRELDFTLFMVSHVNDDGKTRGSRNISKVADLIISLDRNIEADTYDERNKTRLTVRGNRYAGLSGPAGALMFDPKTFKLSELKIDDTKEYDPGFN